MRPTDFSKSLTDFLSRYLPGERGVSKNTISSYRDAFILYLTFVKEIKGLKAEKLTLSQITKENVVEFLNWIEIDRNCCTATRNVRLAAIHSFFQYLQY
ncbi:MAG: site-specific integrase, partial [Clostridium sp.]|nr:site-specific integrase [Clostridium sp.]